MDDRTLDTVTLVLLVGFVISLVALSFLLARSDREAVEDRLPEPPRERALSPIPLPDTRPRAELPSPTSSSMAWPAWLAGVALPVPEQQLTALVAVIESLLAARRDRDLPAGLALYSPSFRARLAGQLGVPEDALTHVLTESTIQGDAPTLRSVELIDATGPMRTIRAGYLDRSAELYRFVLIDGQWAIESIEPA